MTVVPLLAVGIVLNLMAVLFCLISVVLILVVLIQKGRGGGLSAAFGGGMAGGLLGSKTGDFLTWATITLVAVYLVMAVFLDRFYRPSVGEFGGEQTSSVSVEQTSATQPGATSAGAPQSTPAPQLPAGTEQSQPPAQPSTDAGAGAPAPEPPSAGN